MLYAILLSYLELFVQCLPSASNLDLVRTACLSIFITSSTRLEELNELMNELMALNELMNEMEIMVFILIYIC